MSNILLASDPHFTHSNILTFTNYDGTKLRSFDSVEHMNETMIENHNNVVRPKDKVYWLGDLAMQKKFPHEIFSRLNGEKVLIKGNHDQSKLSDYVRHFKDVRGSHQLSKMLLTHIPVHPDSLGRWTANVHGHLHSNEVMLNGVPDPRYLCISMERFNYTPISLEDVIKLVAKRQEI